MVVLWLQQHCFNVADTPDLKFGKIVFSAPFGHHVSCSLGKIATGRENYAVEGWPFIFCYIIKILLKLRWSYLALALALNKPSTFVRADDFLRIGIFVVGIDGYWLSFTRFDSSHIKTVVGA